MIRPLRLIALACVLVLLCLDAGRAQVPFEQADVRAFRKGSIDLVVATHADIDKNFSIRVNASDARAQVQWVVIKAGANKLNELKSCLAQEFDITGLSCTYLWGRSVMPVTAEYTITVTLKTGIKYDVYGKWQRPELTVP